MGGSGTKSVSSKPNFFSVGKKPGGAFAKPAFKMMGGASKKMGSGASGAPNIMSKGPTLGGAGPPKITQSKRQDDIEQLNGEQEPMRAPPDRSGGMNFSYGGGGGDGMNNHRPIINAQRPQQQ